MTTDAAPWLAQIRAAIDEARSGSTPEDLAMAPILSPWHPILTLEAEPLLWGHVNGHPILGARWITTARLIALDPNGQWARTSSRWYRLGRTIAQPAAGPEAPECRQPACGDRTRLAVDAARLGCLPVRNRALLDRARVPQGPVARARRHDRRRAGGETLSRQRDGGAGAPATTSPPAKDCHGRHTLCRRTASLSKPPPRRPAPHALRS